jgi:hypothetical protein
MERMSLPGAGGELHCPAFEEHYGNANAADAASGDSLAQSVKVCRIEILQVELRLAIEDLSSS